MSFQVAAYRQYHRITLSFDFGAFARGLRPLWPEPIPAIDAPRFWSAAADCSVKAEICRVR